MFCNLTLSKLHCGGSGVTVYHWIINGTPLYILTETNAEYGAKLSSGNVLAKADIEDLAKARRVQQLAATAVPTKCSPFPSCWCYTLMINVIQGGPI